MSSEQYAFLRRSEFPTTKALQESIDSDPLFKLTIDDDTDLSNSSGYVPCVICGVKSGVEIDFDDSPELVAQFPDIIRGRDVALVFRFGGDAIECACAMVLCLVLAECYNAVISYEGDPPSSLDALRDEALAIHKEAELSLE